MDKGVKDKDYYMQAVHVAEQKRIKQVQEATKERELEQQKVSPQAEKELEIKKEFTDNRGLKSEEKVSITGHNLREKPIQEQASQQTLRSNPVNEQNRNVVDLRPEQHQAVANDNELTKVNRYFDHSLKVENRALFGQMFDQIKEGVKHQSERAQQKAQLKTEQAQQKQQVQQQVRGR